MRAARGVCAYEAGPRVRSSLKRPETYLPKRCRWIIEAGPFDNRTRRGSKRNISYEILIWIVVHTGSRESNHAGRAVLNRPRAIRNSCRKGPRTKKDALIRDRKS